LKGEKAAVLPVLGPIQFELMIKRQGRQGARPYCARPCRWADRI